MNFKVAMEVSNRPVLTMILVVAMRYDCEQGVIKMLFTVHVAHLASWTEPAKIVFMMAKRRNEPYDSQYR